MNALSKVVKQMRINLKEEGRQLVSFQIQHYWFRIAELPSFKVENPSCLSSPPPDSSPTLPSADAGILLGSAKKRRAKPLDPRKKPKVQKT